MNHLTILKRAAALVIMVFAHAINLHAADFYVCYTRLDYQQPQDPALLGRIPVNATKVFAGDQADRADQVPRPHREGTIRWGPYADLIVNVATGRRLVFGRAAGYLPYLETPKGRFPLQPADSQRCRAVRAGRPPHHRADHVVEDTHSHAGTPHYLPASS